MTEPYWDDLEKIDDATPVGTIGHTWPMAAAELYPEVSA